MQRIGNKVSYIKKPLAKASLVAAGLAAVSLLFGAAALALGYVTGGMRRWWRPRWDFAAS